MDILIKNLELPKEIKDSYCLFVTPYNVAEFNDRGLDPDKPRHDVIVLTEHGDLVDRGILTDILEKEIRLRRDNADEAMLLKGVLYEILKAPVILPSNRVSAEINIFNEILERNKGKEGNAPSANTYGNCANRVSTEEK